MCTAPGPCLALTFASSAVFDVHGPLTAQSWPGHYYWVTFIDDYSRSLAIYFLFHKSDVFDAFRKHKAWAENVTGCRIEVPRDDKGSEYMSGAFDSFLVEAGNTLFGIRRNKTVLLNV